MTEYHILVVPSSWMFKHVVCLWRHTSLSHFFRFRAFVFQILEWNSGMDPYVLENESHKLKKAQMQIRVIWVGWIEADIQCTSGSSFSRAGPRILLIPALTIYQPDKRQPSFATNTSIHLTHFTYMDEVLSLWFSPFLTHLIGITKHWLSFVNIYYHRDHRENYFTHIYLSIVYDY